MASNNNCGGMIICILMPDFKLFLPPGRKLQADSHRNLPPRRVDLELVSRYAQGDGLSVYTKSEGPLSAEYV